MRMTTRLPAERDPAQEDADRIAGIRSRLTRIGDEFRSRHGLLAHRNADYRRRTGTPITRNEVSIKLGPLQSVTETRGVFNAHGGSQRVEEVRC